MIQGQKKFFPSQQKELEIDLNGLLWKNENVELPDSNTMALRRLEGAEKKLKRD